MGRKVRRYGAKGENVLKSLISHPLFIALLREIAPASDSKGEKIWGIALSLTESGEKNLHFLGDM